jgi:hypothetical protein
MAQSTTTRERPKLMSEVPPSESPNGKLLKRELPKPRILQKMRMLSELCPGAVKDVETMIDLGEPADVIRQRLKSESYQILLSDQEIASYAAWLPRLRLAGREMLVQGGMLDYFATKAKTRRPPR